MMKLFLLQEDTVEFRAMQFRVREITHGERVEIVRQIREDATLGPALFAAYGSVDPRFTPEQALGAPSQLIDLLARKIMTLSGMNLESDGTDAGKG